MFREYVQLCNESVSEGVSRGIQMFLENLNHDLEVEEICESFGGVENALKQVFTESGIEISAATEEKEEKELLDENFEAKLDAILEQLKGEKIIE
jgi:hypothetical protein